MRRLVLVVFLSACSTPQPKLETRLVEEGDAPVKMIDAIDETVITLQPCSVTDPTLLFLAVNGKDEVRFGLSTDIDTYQFHFPTVQRDDVCRELTGDAFFGFSWRHVASMPDGRTYLGILDHDIEGPAWALEFVVSGDGGRTWTHRAHIPKSHYTGEFLALTMDRKGHGTLTIRVEDLGQGNAGLYQHRTDDYGYSWTVADRLPDDSQWVQRER